jgi:hypothetical protein
MKDWTELFDAILQNVAAYPVTIWNLLFHPLRIFQQANPEWTCIPSLTYIFTIILSYVWFEAVYLQQHRKSPDWLTPTNVIVLAAAYVGIIANIQQFAVDKFVGIAADVSLKQRLDAFVYAFCPTLFFSVIVATAGWFESNALYIMTPILQAVYLRCLYNVSMASLHLSPGTALRSAFLAWGCFIGIVALLSGIAFLLFAVSPKSRKSATT